MNKPILNILGIGILIIILISLTLTFTGIIPGKYGDFFIMASSVIIAVFILLYIRKKRMMEKSNPKD
jgi:hypothetical protein